MSTALSKTDGSLKGLISNEAMQKQFAAALPKHLSAERFGRVAITALTRTPKLQECTQDSFFKCLLDLSAMGLEPDGRRAHLIPFNNRRAGIVECTLIVDFKGLVELMRRSGDVVAIHSDVICENDQFSHNLGIIERHTFDLSQPRGEMYAAYCQVTFKDGSKQSAIMSKEEIEGIRKRSKAGNSGPWQTDYNEMSKKTAVRRVSKMITLSPEIMDAVERVDRHEYGDMRTVSDYQPNRQTTEANLQALVQGGSQEEELVGSSQPEGHPQPAEGAEEPDGNKPDQVEDNAVESAPLPSTKAYLESYKAKEGKTGNKPWTLHILSLIIDGKEVEATTFEGSIGSLAEFNIESWCLVDLKPNKKGKMDVTAFKPLDDEEEEGGAE